MDTFNNNSCELVSVYKGSFVACTEGEYCMNDVLHEQGNVKTFKKVWFQTYLILNLYIDEYHTDAKKLVLMKIASNIHVGRHRKKVTF